MNWEFSRRRYPLVFISLCVGAISFAFLPSPSEGRPNAPPKIQRGIKRPLEKIERIPRNGSRP